MHFGYSFQYNLFPEHLFFRTLLSEFSSILFMPVPLKAFKNKLSYSHLLIKVFSKGKIIDYFEYLIVEHTL